MRYLTAGESHGPALAGILEGFPAGVDVAPAFIEEQLRRRRTAVGRSPRQRKEKDAVSILSGLHRGRTTGAPICVLLPNALGAVRRETGVPLPGHADLPGLLKYALPDASLPRERASARETAMRVALACFARRLLEKLGIVIASRVVGVGRVVDSSEFRGPLKLLAERVARAPALCLDQERGRDMIAAIRKAARGGETLGGAFEVYAEGVPPGLGSYAQWDRRLDGRIAAQFLSLNAVKAVELGWGAGLSLLSGAQAADPLTLGPGGRARRALNVSGGIEAGVSNGERIVVRASMRPPPGTELPVESVDLRTGRKALISSKRSDTCAVPAAAVIGESLLALELAGALLEKFGPDSFIEIESRLKAWRRRCRFPFPRTR